MRMWMVKPALMCRSHLLGEHGEIHKHRHNFVKQHSIAGRRGQIEPLAMQKRHDALAREMLKRGYKHESPYEQPSTDHLPAVDRRGRVDRKASLRELLDRCQECRDRAATA